MELPPCFGLLSSPCCNLVAEVKRRSGRTSTGVLPEPLGERSAALAVAMTSQGLLDKEITRSFGDDGNEVRLGLGERFCSGNSSPPR